MTEVHNPVHLGSSQTFAGNKVVFSWAITSGASAVAAGMYAGGSGSNCVRIASLAVGATGTSVRRWTGGIAVNNPYIDITGAALVELEL